MRHGKWPGRLPAFPKHGLLSMLLIACVKHACHDVTAQIHDTHACYAVQTVILLHESQQWRATVKEEGELWRDMVREVVHDIGFT